MCIGDEAGCRMFQIPSVQVHYISLTIPNPDAHTFADITSGPVFMLTLPMSMPGI